MNSKEYLENAKHLDSIGAFSISDEIDNEIVKIASNIKEAQSWKADPNLPEAEQGPIAGLENIGRAYVGSWQRAFGLIEFKIKNDAVPTLNAFIISDYSKEPSNKDFESALWRAKEALIKEFGARKINAVRPNWRVVDTLKGLKDDDKYEVYKRFTNWVNYQRQILGNSGRASAYLRALKNAENIIAKKIDPSFTPSAISAPSASTPSRTTPSGGAGAGRGPGGGGGRPSGGGARPSGRPRPSATFDTNAALFHIVYKKVKSLYPDKSPSDFGALMPEIYDKISKDETLKQSILEAIDASSYSSANKQKLKDKFNAKIGVAPSPTPGPEPTPGPTPGPEPTPEPSPSPFPSERDIKGFPFLNDQVNDLQNKSDDEFMKIFDSKSSILQRQVMKSYQARNILPEEYIYLTAALDRMKLRYQKLLQGMS